ncbi:MAG: hypothetical protein LIO69_02870 [Oscillospiraceae bacterium]|nr:hypothetical protein [Oscillospiraceae bacterium]
MKLSGLKIAFHNAFIYYMKIALIFLGFAAAIVIGAANVEVKCHNIINNDHISFLEIDTDDGLTITFAGNTYRLS